ncbi:MAG: hypothetical protein H8E98_05240 [Bacteroidetes bacterium]|nr:hypothetical protein [Bacteroidota bacterium]
MKNSIQKLNSKDLKYVSGGFEPFMIILPIGLVAINALVYFGKKLADKYTISSQYKKNK